MHEDAWLQLRNRYTFREHDLREVTFPYGDTLGDELLDFQED